MALPQNTATLCQFLLGLDQFPDDSALSVSSRNSVISIDTWDETALGRPEPLEAELLLADSDVTVINGQTFSQWYAEHGGDPAATAKRVAKKLYEDLQSQNRVLRAIVKLTVDELNNLRQWLESFKSEVALSNNLADLKGRVATLPAMSDRTYAQAKTAIENNVDAE